MLARARHMRRQPTRSEAMLWRALRGRSLGVKFRRQHILLDMCIVDFCAPSLRLIIEIDGAVHAGDRLHHDQLRERWLREAGYRVIRVKAWMVERHLDVVVSVIRAAL